MANLFLISIYFLSLISEFFLADYPYCFRFTWIGPYLDKKNINRLTCEDLREGSTTIPCRLPLVATSNLKNFECYDNSSGTYYIIYVGNDTIPDTVDLWRHYKNDLNAFGCPMTPGQACVKYTYFYNKGVQNITYMCAKVNASDGCYHQKFISGSEVEVCVCQSRLGEMPCNYAATTYSNSSLLMMMAVVIWLINKLN